MATETRPVTIQNSMKVVSLKPSTKHDYYNGCETGDCGGTCPHCTLSICKVCGGAEGSLTTHCPNEKVTAIQGELVYAGLLDFRSGHWMYGLKNRGMYNGVSDYYINETIHLELLRKQPLLDLNAITECKKYLGYGKEYLNRRDEDGGGVDAFYANVLKTDKQIRATIKTALSKYNYATPLHDNQQKQPINSLPDLEQFLFKTLDTKGLIIEIREDSKLSKSYWVHVLSILQENQFLTNQTYTDMFKSITELVMQQMGVDKQQRLKEMVY